MILNLFDPELQLINRKTMIKNKFKKMLSKMKKFKVVLTMRVCHYKT